MVILVTGSGNGGNSLYNSGLQLLGSKDWQYIRLNDRDYDQKRYFLFHHDGDSPNMDFLECVMNSVIDILTNTIQSYGFCPYYDL